MPCTIAFTCGLFPYPCATPTDTWHASLHLRYSFLIPYRTTINPAPRSLSLAAHRLTSMLGLERCTALEELYLSHNGIQRLEGLSSLPRLRMLDVSSNMLTAIEPDALAGNTQLEDLWLNDNQLPAIDAALDRALEPVRHSLTCIYLEGNPAVSKEWPWITVRYRTCALEGLGGTA